MSPRLATLELRDRVGKTRIPYSMKGTRVRVLDLLPIIHLFAPSLLTDIGLAATSSSIFRQEAPHLDVS